jgi:hypothetical protein
MNGASAVVTASRRSRGGYRLTEDTDAARPIPNFHDRIDRALQEFVRYQKSVGILGALTLLDSCNVTALKEIEPIPGGHGRLPVIKLPKVELQKQRLVGVKRAVESWLDWSK